MFMTLGFILGFVLGWIVRWKLDGIIDFAKRLRNRD
jgi:hypothetical protein